MAKQLYAKKHLDTWAGSLNKNGGAPSAKNLADAFTPTQPMYAAGDKPDRIRAKGDVPAALTKAIAKGMSRIGPLCLKQNAEIFLSVYEDICLKHVLDKQIQGKDLKKLLAVRDTQREQDHANQKKVVSNVVAHSSLIGRDPWGDEETPKPTLATDDAANVNATGYTREQLLLMEVQNQNYLYLVAHTEKILEDPIATSVKARELVYDRNENGVPLKTERNH